MPVLQHCGENNSKLNPFEPNEGTAGNQGSGLGEGGYLGKQTKGWSLGQQVHVQGLCGERAVLCRSEGVNDSSAECRSGGEEPAPSVCCMHSSCVLRAPALAAPVAPAVTAIPGIFP